MRTSCYTLPFDIPDKGKSLFIHGYTGAIDMVGLSVADRLKSADGVDVSALFGKDTLQTLVERGYFTERTEEQEHEYVHHILDVFKRKTASSVSFAFQLQGSGEEIRKKLTNRLDAVFRTLNRLRERYIGGVLALDLTQVTGNFDFLPDIIKHANDWSYTLIVTISPDMSQQVIPHLSPGKIQYLRIASKDPGVNKNSKDGLLECLNHLLQVGMKAEWLFYVDAESLTGIEQALAMARAVKQDPKNKKGQLNFILVSDGSVIDASPALRLNGEFLSVIPTPDVFLYHFVGRFIDSPGQINFRPYFSPRGSTYVLDSACNVFVLPAPGVKEPKRVGRWTDGGITLDESQVDQYEAECNKCDFSDSCDNCHLSLICGGACSRTSSLSSAHDGAPACAASFRSRLERVLPLVLFNKSIEA